LHRFLASGISGQTRETQANALDIGSSASVGPTSVVQAQLLQALAEMLRGEFEDLLGEPLPNQLNVLVEQLNKRRTTAKRRPEKARPLGTHS
jgi:hypothetical protein